MIIDTLKDAILSNIGPLKSANKGWQKRHCMLCHTQGHGKDTRNRFGIQFNATTILANCFNCKFSAGYTEGQDLTRGMKFLLSQLNIDQKLIQYIEFEIFKHKNQISSIREGVTEEDTESKFKALFQKWKPMDLPEGSLSITEWLENDCDDPDFLRVVDYAIGRKIFDLDEFYWSPLRDMNVNQRLTIPYYYNRKIVGFTSRLCFKDTDKYIPKYFQQCPLDFVYNLDHQSGWSRKYVLVNEGVLDAWSVDGIGILGEVNQEKIGIINRLQKEVIVCPDRDSAGAGLVEAAIENNWSVAFPKWSDGIKDASKASEKYGRLLTTHSIIASAVSGKDKIYLKWEIDNNARKRKRN
jgi:hypothetical protein